MKKVSLYTIALLLFAAWVLFSCEDEKYVTSEDAKLVFSVDTLMFDTIFTTVGSTTQSFRVINQYNRPILISSIELAGGDQSEYHLNIDGILSNELYDIEIPANDSIYIFVVVTVDPNGFNQPMIVQDSIVFVTNENVQDIDLVSWGQDFVPIESEIITTTTWTSEKPYLVYQYAYVDSGEVLTIEAGTQIYFHNDAGLYVKGLIKALGSPAAPIVFSGDRLEDLYDDVPDQWRGILLFPNEDGFSDFENVEIKNANIGLQVGTIENEGSAHVRLHNVKIEHMAYAGIFALKSEIVATNTLVADCGYYCITLLIGGSYDFTHCTVANYWDRYSNRQTASVAISNVLKVGSGEDAKVFVGNMVHSNWNNSIIWGNLASEIEIGNNEEADMNYMFDHCILKIADSVNVANVENYYNIQKNIDPKFIDYREYNYELDTLSRAKDMGKIEFGELVPFDFNQVSRLDDDAPDLGAYERVEKKKEK